MSDDEISRLTVCLSSNAARTCRAVDSLLPEGRDSVPVAWRIPAVMRTSRSWSIAVVLALLLSSCATRDPVSVQAQRELAESLPDATAGAAPTPSARETGSAMPPAAGGTATVVPGPTAAPGADAIAPFVPSPVVQATPTVDSDPVVQATPTAVSDPAATPGEDATATVVPGPTATPGVDPTATPTVEVTATPTVEEAPTAAAEVTATPTTTSGSAAVDTPLGSIPATGALPLDLEVGPPAAQVTWVEVRPGSGEPIGPADTVRINYVMYEVSSGELVERTLDPLLLRLGEGSVPLALEDAIADHTAGARFVVGFPSGMSDLPFYFEPGAYTLVVDVLAAE